MKILAYVLFDDLDDAEKWIGDEYTMRKALHFNKSVVGRVLTLNPMHKPHRRLLLYLLRKLKELENPEGEKPRG